MMMFGLAFRFGHFVIRPVLRGDRHQLSGKIGFHCRIVDSRRMDPHISGDHCVVDFRCLLLEFPDVARFGFAVAYCCWLLHGHLWVRVRFAWSGFSCSCCYGHVESSLGAAGCVSERFRECRCSIHIKMLLLFEFSFLFVFFSLLFFLPFGGVGEEMTCEPWLADPVG